MSVRFSLSTYMARSATAAMILLAIASTASPVRADVVTDWNVIALDTISRARSVDRPMPVSWATCGPPCSMR
jgi:hypothetical protein